MRNSFIETLFEIAEKDERVVLLTGDLGYSVMEPFAERFPKRFYNVGVAEQNMVGIATGLAATGYIPFCYSIATFASMRPYEFFRSGAILHGYPVRIVGVGGGFEYGTAGPTHYGLEDVGLMRVQPGLALIAPADAAQTKTALKITYDLPGPVYYRLGKDEKVVVEGLSGRFELGSVQVVREGADAIFVTMGGISREAVLAANELEKVGISVAVAVVACLNPSPVEGLASLLRQYRISLTVESHYMNGGLGSLVAEVISEKGIPCRLMRCAVSETPGSTVGSEKYMNKLNGLDSLSLSEKMQNALRGFAS